MTYMSENASKAVPIEGTVEYPEGSTELTLVADGSARLPSVVNVQGLGKIIAASGFFKDARQAAKATVKVLAGQELGFAPIFSMSNIHIIEGKIAMGAMLIAAKIRDSGEYDYQITKHTNEGCAIEIHRYRTYDPPRPEGKLIGKTTFDKADAKRANLLGKSVWKKYPRNLYFARAISNAAKWFVPHLFGGAIYTPEELGAMVTDDGTVIIEGEVEDITERVTEPALNLRGSAAVDDPTPSMVGGRQSATPRDHALELHAEGMSVEQITENVKAPAILVRSWLGETPV